MNFKKLFEALDDRYSNLNIILSLCVCIFMGYTSCQEDKTIDLLKKDKNIPQHYQTQKLHKKPAKNIKTKILFLPSANGYDYGIYNYDFTPLMENEFQKKSYNIKVMPFPFKKLMGINYHGVWNKKHCSPIIEKVTVDFLILTRFTQENFHKTPRLNIKWGYETKIIHTKSLREIHSINVHNLDSYEALEEHIKDNIENFKKDIETLNKY